MLARSLCRAVLIAMVFAILAKPARGANTFATDAKLVETGIVVVSAAVAVLIAVLVIHHRSKKSAITGCVTSGLNGTSVSDEKDKRVYALSGDSVGIKPGDRMTLEGKRRKQSSGALVFEVHGITRDFGSCQP
jgi:hypothetical protein